MRFMMLLRCVFLSLQVAIVTGTGDINCSDGLPPPLRIYVLVGQSNMEGKGATEHLEELLEDNLTSSVYEHYGSPDNYTVRDDVYLYFQDYEVWQTPLTVGYGTPHNSTFGPELEFGWVVGDDYLHNGAECAKTLIIKCAWGGKNLAVDFRSPSSGLGNYTHSCDEDGNCIPYKPSEYGFFYRWMVQTVNDVVGNLTNVLPCDYSNITQYSIAGLVWFQGWNDVIFPPMVAEYASNLANFIRDVRKDFEVPNLPVVIGELGQAGPVPEGQGDYKHVGIRKQMRSVAILPDMVGTTRYVMTAPFIDDAGPSFNGNYHYYGRADTFFYIGRSFGTAMVQLLQDNPDSIVVKNITSPDSEKDGGSRGDLGTPEKARGSSWAASLKIW